MKATQLHGLKGMVGPHQIVVATLQEGVQHMSDYTKSQPSPEFIVDATVLGQVDKPGEVLRVRLFDATVDLVGNGLVIKSEFYFDEIDGYQSYTQLRLRVTELNAVEKGTNKEIEP